MSFRVYAERDRLFPPFPKLTVSHSRFRHLRHQVTSILADFVQSLNSLLPCTLRSSHEVLVVEEDSVHLPEDSHQKQDQHVCNVTNDALPDDALTLRLSHEVLVVEEDSVHLPEDSRQEQDQRNVTIHVLPDDALVEIFSFYVNAQTSESDWHRLVHVCRRWRYVVFSSPHRLNLRLAYKGMCPLRTTLDTWPPLPLVILRQYKAGVDHKHYLLNRLWSSNIAAALESGHDNRISKIHLYSIPSSHWGKIAATMQKPFPELTSLTISALSTGASPVLVIPDLFLGGSAPRLRSLQLRNCSFPGIQKLLLSANHLVTLHLGKIPDSGYISPQAMVTALSTMARLESLHLEFLSPRLRPTAASRPPPPSVRLVLPALTQLDFQGVHGYLEDLVTQIDAPLLSNFKVTFFMDPNFEVRQLHRFISHAEKFKKLDHATVSVSNDAIAFFIPVPGYRVDSQLEIRCKRLDLQLSSLAQVFNSFLPLLSTLEKLHIRESVIHYHPRWKDDIESTQWLRLLNPFTAVESLSVVNGSVRCVCDALKEVTDVLPALQSLFIWALPHGPTRKPVGTFVAKRRLSGHPVSVYHREGIQWKDVTQELLSED